MRFLIEQNEYRELIKKAHSCNNNLEQHIKLLLVTDWTSQFLCESLKCCGLLGGAKLDIVCEINDDIEMGILAHRDEVYDVLLIIPEFQQLKQRIRYLGQNWLTLEKQRIDRICQIGDSITKTVIIANYLTERSNFFCQEFDINNYLSSISEKNEKINYWNLSSLVSEYGREHVINISQYYNSKCIYTFDFLAEMSRQLWNYLTYKSGFMIKCIAVDFDDTLYGGTLSEDGIENLIVGGIGIGESFAELQEWLKERKSQGILLAACTKNDYSQIELLLGSKSPMRLKMDDFSVICANWNNKDKNIEMIAQNLHINPDSILFLDDQIFEREAMRELQPEVYVPDLSELPENRVCQLNKMGIFFQSDCTKEDDMRTNFFHDEMLREKAKKLFSNFTDYLQSLEMKANVELINNSNLQRIHELSMRSNRFNLRTIRYQLSDLQKMKEDDNYIIYCVRLSDRVGDYGLIGVMVIKLLNDNTGFIENIFMSCRVLNRGTEHFMMNYLIEDLKHRGISKLIGEFISTKKNEMMKDFLVDYGFVKQEEQFILVLSDYIAKPVFIHKI